MNIIQQPLYRMVATDEEIIFAVSDAAIVAPNFKVKFEAAVYVGTTDAGIFTQTKIATLKVTPNEVGSGIFDFSRILESYVSPDYLGGETAVVNGIQQYSKANGINHRVLPHSIHQIDKHSFNRNVCRSFGIKFLVEYATTPTGALIKTSPELSDTFYIHNAVRQEDDLLGYEVQRSWFGYNYDWNYFALNDTDAKFLTNAPTTQYIGEADYCTIAYFNQSDDGTGQGTLFGKKIGSGNANLNLVKFIRIKFYNAANVSIGAALDYYNIVTNGSVPWDVTTPKGRIQYTGVGTANIIGAGGSLPGSWHYYTVQAFDDTLQNAISKPYYFYKQEVCKGFEKFRLTWLNRLGVWDYFNFTKKNVRKVNSKRETYQQIKGNWNEFRYSKHGYKGGKKTFSTNSKEVVTLQTDFITEETAQWLEELFTSPDVFVLQERTTDTALGTAQPSSVVYNVMNKYVQPCIVTTSSYTRKTTANDKLKQYTVEIEMSHNKRIQKA